MNAPVISLLGFADVNRQLFRGVSRKVNKDGIRLSIDLFRHLDVLPTGRSGGKNKIVNFTEYDSPWVANNLLASQEILLNLWKFKIYYLIHKWSLAI
jgi:hypothetical protein